ncbi:hypothetical protein S100892_02290 (plasmid) [Pediococcus pentosaceus]|uniref:Uncharacterized protein n=1 Tax=Pediococcus pentosaceus TaxID=1255 RepID=A0A1Y0VRM5_PEDPE|nr:hypothetical protein S100892_02290 [Pediococcus pentosaceus]
MPKILDSSSVSWSAIDLILHDGLKAYKPRNSKILSRVKYIIK